MSVPGVVRPPVGESTDRSFPPAADAGLERPARPPTESPTAPGRALPYGPTMTGLLGPLHRVFLVVNRRVATPALRAGLGPVFSSPVAGYRMLLRTRGRRTGRVREAPLGYVIVDEAVYCCAGFGPDTAWLRNLRADPRVEVVLPDRVLSGTAEPVLDPDEWVRAYRALVGSLGLVGRLTVGRIADLDDAALLSRHGGIPVVRIRATGVRSGPMDPGGRFWLVPWLVTALVALAARCAISRRWLPR